MKISNLETHVGTKLLRRTRGYVITLCILLLTFWSMVFFVKGTAGVSWFFGVAQFPYPVNQNKMTLWLRYAGL